MSKRVGRGVLGVVAFGCVASAACAPALDEQPFDQSESALGSGGSGGAGSGGSGGSSAAIDAFDSTALAYANYWRRNGGIACNVTVDDASYGNLRDIPDAQFKAMWMVMDMLSSSYAEQTSQAIWGSWGTPR